MDVHTKLAEVRQLIDQARSMPMSASAVVNRQEMRSHLDQLQNAVDAMVQEASRATAEHDAVLAEARSEAEGILAEAREQRDRLVSETEVFRVARQQAEQVLAEARAEAEGLRTETDQYVDKRFATFEVNLERTLEAVRRGRQRLAGRTSLDSLQDDEVNQIKLPEHFRT